MAYYSQPLIRLPLEYSQQYGPPRDSESGTHVGLGKLTAKRPIGNREESLTRITYNLIHNLSSITTYGRPYICQNVLMSVFRRRQREKTERYIPSRASYDHGRLVIGTYTSLLYQNACPKYVFLPLVEFRALRLP